MAWTAGLNQSRDGEKSFYVVNMSVDERKASIASLMEVAMALDKIYRHMWCDNDFWVWDNRCMLHRGQPFDNQKYRRHMIRTTVLAA